MTIAYRLEDEVGMSPRSVSQEVLYSDFTAVTVTGTLNMRKQIPAGSFVIGSKVRVLTAFAGGSNTTCVLDAGTSGDDDLFSYTTHNLAAVANNLVEGADSTAGGTTGTGFAPIATATTVQLKGTVDDAWSGLTAGKAVVWVYYLSTNPE